jgi:hypothetical protein
VRAGAEPGWVRVAYPVVDRRAPGDDVFLYYCPVHAGHFDLGHPGVAPAFDGA